eukprot:gb/GEZN01007402.1/.p1 GENE.gb/GEZN01007402.1/~~gb/GEZN01007402.1/.p1  ORF type:complete len:419 (-),score=41.81 gb/GEZN01007402.1/:139-1395(-)
MQSVLSAISALFSIYTSMILGWSSAKMGLITPETRPALSVILVKIVVPCQVFEWIASSDFHSMDYRILGVFLLFLSLGAFAVTLLCRYRQAYTIEDALTDFLNLSFSNNFVLGIPVITALYGVEDSALVTVLAGLSAGLQVPFAILTFEYILARRKLKSQKALTVSEAQGSDISSPETHAIELQNFTAVAQTDGVSADFLLEDEMDSRSTSENEGKADLSLLPDGMGGEEETKQKELSPTPSARKSTLELEHGFSIIVFRRALGQMIKNNVPWAALLGITYSLIAHAPSIGLGYPPALANVIRPVTRSLYFLALFDLGWFSYGKSWVSCSVRELLRSLLTKFVAAPLLMLFCCFVCNISGLLMKILVLVNAMPHAVLISVLAGSYKVKYEMATSSLIISTLLALPLIPVLDSILGSMS